ncbi:HAMP domain-containing sensor histidine kinase [Paremcibacter congregatus]|uniref:histidine kinase n=1 Tax=Paremcibacter congregatus TaxID=2043170 RepID=A0A2G4YNF8_9PROT|nr:HAMP domain-containing sensor histidine kinase [Paremcibacter congregatus]PHZ83869.1 hypothetical protein CRD36_16095 [Paremcibacter congregatus]QDE27574.1 HAMP domain-containing histidine kinase [Paremcibacter congregatus]
MKLFSRLIPKSMTGQMIAILTLALTLLLATFTILEFLKNDTAIETAQKSDTLDRLKRIKPILENIEAEQLENFFTFTSSCHEGYTLTDKPFDFHGTTEETNQLEMRIAQELPLDESLILVGQARLTQDNFSYKLCSPSEIDLPMDGIVISIKLRSGKWFNTEVHPHEWHVQYIIDWIMWSGSAFFIIGGTAIFFMRRLSKPLNNLTNATQSFGRGLNVSEVEESGPPDVKRAIESFNAMQKQVADEITKRTNTLAAISHDVRTPLTALRIKAELIDDLDIREDLISSINKMEKITTSALEFLRGESRTEPMRNVDLSALVESECLDFSELGQKATFIGKQNIHYTCRPDALARAIRNLIENALKYAGSARVDLQLGTDFVSISISDDGPGIPHDKIICALEPFERLSKARESNQGGFGLGLTVAKAISEGHDGELILTANKPTGLIATIQLPKVGQF